jgi:hypothetical protein
MTDKPQCGNCAHFKEPKSQKMLEFGFRQCELQEKHFYRPAHLTCAFEPPRFSPKAYLEA